MKKKRIIWIIIVVLILFNTISYGKYIIENTYTVAHIKIDCQIPIIKKIKIENTNIGYEKYANQTHQIKVKIQVKEKNIKENHIFEPNWLTARIGETIIPTEKITIKEVAKYDDIIEYDLLLKNLEGNGRLKINIKQGTIVDISDNVNEDFWIDTGIEIDNIAPQGAFIEKEIANRKSRGKCTI